MHFNHISPAKTRAQKEHRANHILESALVLFVEKGFSATRLEDVARHAGISKGTLYLYFENKEALFKRLVEEMVVPLVQNAEHEVNAYQGPCNNLLQQLILGWWKMIGKTSLSGLPKLLISESGNFPDLAEYYVKNVVARVRRLLTTVIQRGIAAGEFIECDAEGVARVILSAVVFPVVLQHSLGIYDTAFENDRYQRAHMELILNGMVTKR